MALWGEVWLLAPGWVDRKRMRLPTERGQPHMQPGILRKSMPGVSPSRRAAEGRAGTASGERLGTQLNFSSWPNERYR